MEPSFSPNSILHQIIIRLGCMRRVSRKRLLRLSRGIMSFLSCLSVLPNAPATFQSVMNTVLSPFLDRFVLVYIDDILIYSKTLEEHLQHLRLVLQALRDNKFYCKTSKCRFCTSQVAYLGHIISSEGVQMDPEKITAIVSWPTPKCLTELRSFLGLVQYYDNFIAHFAEVAFPLTQLFKKDTPWVWTGVEETAFKEVKRLVSSAPCLLMPDLNKPFVLHVDASGFAWGVCCSKIKAKDCSLWRSSLARIVGA
jgi:Reverse transcriptase (RNA-dependent DNA polymerase)/RNase H-like domain found in reverse transcriptase